MPRDDEPDFELDAEDRMLIALWAELDEAADLSTLPRAIRDLDLIAGHLEAALKLVARWKAGDRDF
jgi:hypothetical protein